MPFLKDFISLWKTPVMSKATRNMITAKAAPVGHSSPATWKKPAMVSAKTVVDGPPKSTGVA